MIRFLLSVLCFFAVAQPAISDAKITSEVLKFQMVGSNDTPIAQTEFEIKSLFITNGTNITVQFPLFNFQTLSSTPTSLQSINKLPRKFRPTTDLTFLCSNNDAFLPSFNNPTSGPVPIPFFNLIITTEGNVIINNIFNPVTPVQGHTFNSQTVTYTGQVETKEQPISTSTNIFTLQVNDNQYFPISGTSFTVGGTVFTQKDLVTVQLPSFTFTILDETAPGYVPPALNGDPLIINGPGGFVSTIFGALPKNLRPEEIQTIYDPTTGFNFSIDTYGNLLIASSGAWTGVIPPGTYTTVPVTIAYKRPESKKVRINNFIIQPAFSNITGFTDAGALGDGYRDSHVNDNYKGTLAWTWTDNSAQTDKTNNTMDVYVAIGKSHGSKVKVGKPINLTNFPVGVQGWDTAVAINRTNPDNIVVSFGRIDRTVSPRITTLMVCVSNDRGKTWSAPINIDPTLTFFGDARGVISDKYGNFWYSATSRNADSTIINLLFYASSDAGNTWSLVFQTTDSNASTGATYDYPQITVGNDGQGNYGLWFIGNYFTPDGNLTNHLGFIPTTGRGQFGTGSFIALDQFVNQIGGGDIAVNSKGKVFIYSSMGSYDFLTNYYADTLIVKTPGPLSQNLISQVKTIVNLGQNLAPKASYPVPGVSYFIQPVHGITYDPARKALYTMVSEQPDPTNQNIYLFLLVSFNDGITWSKRIPIGSHNNNRGFESMALDPAKGTLSFSWYDSRNSADSTSDQFFGAFISKSELNRLVNKLRKTQL